MQYLTFHNDKSQLIRGIAIIFMIMLHNGCGIGFKICVSLFTFLVGYGYCFAKQKNLTHAIKRSWHLLSHFWLILFGIFLPIAIVKGGYQVTIPGILEEMFGLESQLNWYSWYIYFYIYAMIAMPLFSRLIDRFKIIGTITLILSSFVLSALIHLIPNWSSNIWLQAAFDCFICTPIMIAGYHCARFNLFKKISLINSSYSSILYLAVAIIIFLLRLLPFPLFLYDFILTTIFVYSVTAIFEVIELNHIQILLKAFGKQSMNMWFLHAMFFTSVTASTTAFLVDWAQPQIFHIIWMIVFSYIMALLVSFIYNFLQKSFEKAIFIKVKHSSL